MRIALPGTPAAFRASTIDWARDRPRFSAADWAAGSLAAASPYPVTPIGALPRLAAKAFTSSAAGCDRLAVPSRNTIVAAVPAGGTGIGAGTAAGAGAGPATPGRGGGSAGKAGCGAAGCALASAATAAGPDTAGDGP